MRGRRKRSNCSSAAPARLAQEAILSRVERLLRLKTALDLKMLHAAEKLSHLLRAHDTSERRSCRSYLLVDGHITILCRLVSLGKDLDKATRFRLAPELVTSMV